MTPRQGIIEAGWALAYIASAVVALLIFLWVVAICSAAPAPLARPAVKPRPARTEDLWYVTRYGWNGDPYHCTFSPFGIVIATSEAGARWEGQWRVEGGLLMVEEKTVNGNPTEFRWQARLAVEKGKLIVTEGGPFSVMATEKRGKR